MHQGQIFKVFLQAVRDRSLFKSEVRWESEKNMLLPLATGFAEETASPEKGTAMGSSFTALQLVVSLQTLSPNPHIFPSVSHYLPDCECHYRCPAWPSVWAAALQIHPNTLPLPSSSGAQLSSSSV